MLKKLLSLTYALILCLSVISVGHSEVVNYKTIDWTVLMPEQWLRAIKKDFDALYKLPNLQDGSPQANKAMQEIQKKLDDAPIVKEQINKKERKETFYT